MRTEGKKQNIQDQRNPIERRKGRLRRTIFKKGRKRDCCMQIEKSVCIIQSGINGSSSKGTTIKQSLMMITFMMSKENTTVLSHPDCLTSIITCIFFHMKKKVIFSFTTKEARQKNNQAASERLIISGEKIKLYCLIIFQFKTRSIHPCLSVNPVDKMPRYYLRNV